MIPYSDLVSEIKSCILEPHDPRLDHLLGQVAEAEDEAARGLQTVVVVHKMGNKIPGTGLFKMAHSPGTRYIRSRGVPDRRIAVCLRRVVVVTVGIVQ